jgi:hypothetical protein
MTNSTPDAQESTDPEQHADHDADSADLHTRAVADLIQQRHAEVQSAVDQLTDQLRTAERVDPEAITATQNRLDALDSAVSRYAD